MSAFRIFREIALLSVLMVMVLAVPLQSPAEGYPPELAPMMDALAEVEAMLADGTFSDDEFSLAVSEMEIATFAQRVKKRLRTAKAEYTRLPRAIRGLIAADEQWYRMESLFKTSEGFSKAQQRHARVLAERSRWEVASPKGSAAATSVSSKTPMLNEVAAQRAADRKQAAESRAAAMRAQQEAVRARAAAVKAEKAAAAQAKAAGIEPTGPNWRNSYIPNIQELQSADGFFQWSWSAPSWEAVTEKAAQEREKGALGSAQLRLFKDFVLEKTDEWPTVARVDEAGDARYALEMIRKREEADGLNVVDLWISRGEWKIQRNALGAILSRTKPGYLLYADPSGKGCILKQLWIKEPYAGGSSYEKATGWRYAKIRFQSCDRR